VTEDNAERVRAAFEAFTRGDMEPLRELLDPDFVVDDRVTPEANPTTRGLDGLIENAAHVYEVFGEINWDPREIVDLGDRVLVRVRVTAKGKSTQLPIDDDVGHIFTMNDNGRATKLVIYRTWDEARRAAGAAD
jgi:ketosteroid isomerase-like protein